MSDKIRRLSIYIVFKFTWQKRMKLLNQWKDCLSLYKFSHEYDYRLPKIEYNVLTCLVKTEIKRTVPWTISKSKACAHQDQERRAVTTYLRILPSLLVHDSTKWWRVDDWWSFPSLVSWVVQGHLFSFVAFILLLSFASLIFLLFSLHSLLCLQQISGQHIPEGVYNF